MKQETPPEREWHIYALIDPFTKKVRYIGWAFNVSKRLSAHIYRSQKEKTHKANWLNSLRESNQRPLVEILESGTGDWAETERRWIQHYLDSGCDLTNATKGGEGIVGYVFSAETREVMASKKRGRKLSQEHIQKHADTLRGRKRPASVGIKISIAKTGKSCSPETIEKIRATKTGQKHTDASKQKMSESQKGRTHSEKTKNLLREQRIGKPLSEEHKAKLSAAKKGKTLTDEHKAKIKASSGGWKHTPETIAKITDARRNRK